MAKTMSRREERELALRGIFQLDFHGEEEAMDTSIETFLAAAGSGDPEEEVPGESQGYAARVISAVRENQTEIDGIIEKYLKSDWTMTRIPAAEKAVLRLSLTEMLYLKVPKEIAINEGLELTKLYGEEDNVGFVNGILNNAAKDYADRLTVDEKK